jgi:hypothetical protein
MTKLPQVNVRVPELFHDLIRKLAQRLRDDASFGFRLEEMLDRANPVANVLSGLEDASTALARIDALEVRTAALEEREPRMVKIDALETRMATLEEMLASPQAAPPTPTIEPRVSGGQGTRRLIRTGDPETASAKRGAVRPRRRKLKP